VSSIQALEAEIIEEFELFDDVNDKYDYIIDLGNKMDAYPESHRSDDFLVKGCQSKVWLFAQKEGENVVYFADSNTAITKGVVSLLVRTLNRQPAAAILASELTFIEQIGLRSLLSSQRSNGLSAMIQKMKWYAEVFK
jgi:cysteine desulfuration protein SufE